MKILTDDQLKKLNTYRLLALFYKLKRKYKLTVEELKYMGRVRRLAIERSDYEQAREDFANSKNRRKRSSN